MSVRENRIAAQEARGGQLLPCPFCGHDDQLYPSYRWPGSGSPYAIDCLRCGFDFTPREGMDVIAMWNTRAAQPEGEAP